MNILIGLVMTILGLLGTSGMFFAITNDRYYNYRSPLTDHETMMLTLFVICLVVALVGIILMIASVVKKNSQDQLDRLNRIGTNPTETGVCPNCKLNLAKNATVCPRCGATVKRE